MTHRLVLVFALNFVLSFAAIAESKGVNISVALSPAGSFQIKSSKVKGKVIKGADGKITANNLRVSIKSLKTGIELRDEHLQKRLEPKIDKKIEVVKAIGKNGKGRGIIKIKGISKKFSFEYKEVGKFVKASFKLSLKEFKISGLSYMGVGVEDVVDVEAVIPIK